MWVPPAVATPQPSGMESFGKTGTASDEKDLVVRGRHAPYHYVTAVWWGYDAPYADMTTLGRQESGQDPHLCRRGKAYMEQVQATRLYKAGFSPASATARVVWSAPTAPRGGSGSVGRGQLAPAAPLATHAPMTRPIPATTSPQQRGVAAAQRARITPRPVARAATNGMDTWMKSGRLFSQSSLPQAIVSPKGSILFAWRKSHKVSLFGEVVSRRMIFEKAAKYSFFLLKSQVNFSILL